MKRAVAVSVLLAACSFSIAVAESAQPRPRPSTLLPDLVRMTKAGDSDAAVLAYAKAHRAELPSEIDDATLRWLAESGVRPAVVSYMSAIDVRPTAADAGVPEGVTYANGPTRARTESESADSYGSEVYTGLSSNAGDFARSPADDYYGSGYGPYDSYAWGYPYPYSNPFPTWFVVDFSRASRFRSHFHDGHRGRGDHGRWGGGWRDRGPRGPRDGRMNGNGSGPRSWGRPSIARGGSPARWAGSRPAVAPRGFATRPRGFAGPPRVAGPMRGGAFARGPIAAPSRGGGGVRAAAPAGGRGRR